LIGVAACLALVATGVLAGGCSAVPEADSLSLLPATTKFDPTRPLMIDVENKSGSVNITVNPKLDRPYVTCRFLDVKTSTPLPDEAKVARKWIDARFVPRADSTQLRVINTRGSAERGGVFIWISIEVPSCAGVRVRNSAGGVAMKDVSGPIDVSNGFGTGEGGPITLTTTRGITDSVSLSTIEGDVMVTMTGRSTGVLDLASTNGPVEMRDRTGQVGNIVQTASTWTGVLNDGENPIKVRSGGGLVRVEVKPDTGRR